MHRTMFQQCFYRMCVFTNADITQLVQASSTLRWLKATKDFVD